MSGTPEMVRDALAAALSSFEAGEVQALFLIIDRGQGPCMTLLNHGDNDELAQVIQRAVFEHLRPRAPSARVN